MQSAYTLPPWLTDEQLLRDEAVLFGLSESPPDEKLAAIRFAFAALTAPLEKQIEQHHEAIGNLNLLLEITDNQLIDSKPNAQSGIARPDQAGGPSSGFTGWPIGWFLLGLVASLLLCAGTYLSTLWLVDAQLALLVAGLAGAGAGVGSLLMSQAMHKAILARNAFRKQQHDETHRQLLTDRANRQLEKQAQIEQLYRAEAALNQQQAHRELLVRLFNSEFDLARSLRHQVRGQYIDL